VATFTIELGALIDVMGVDIGLKEYPIFDESYRLPLNKKILDHYTHREIGYETGDMFVFALNRRMSEIMPYYNELYRSERLKFDPLSTVDLSTLGTSAQRADTTQRQTGSTDNATETHSRAIASTTPQTALKPGEDYADSGSVSESRTEAQAHSDDSTSGSQDMAGSQSSHVTGRQATGASLIAEWRSILVNVDMMVIAELQDLFMSLWNNGDILPDFQGDDYTQYLSGYRYFF
jgi:hypothetical protein